MSKGNEEPAYGLIALVVVVALVVLAAINFVFFPSVLGFTEQRQAGEEITKDTYDADSALRDYRWFRQQHEDIKAQRDIIENHWDEHERFHELHGNDTDDWERATLTRHGRIHDRITGSQNILQTMVADYNARSDDATRALFKCNLPYRVDQQFYVTGPPGTYNEQPDDEYLNGSSPNESAPEDPAECDSLPDEIQEEA